MTIIDAERWLFQHAERLLAESSDDALVALERLLVATQNLELRLYCLKNLGQLHLANGDLDEARKYLRGAASVAPTDPELHHALGELSLRAGHFWLALLHFLEALYHGRDRKDLTNFMRSVASTMRQLELGEIGLSVLIGAYERDPTDPFILDSLARFYESSKRWLDAVEARDALIRVLEGRNALPESKPRRLMLDEEDARREFEHLTERMKREVRIVDETHDRSAPTELSRVNFPSGLHTLVHALGLRSHNLPLLETAEALWAQALDRKLDLHLSVSTLAAAIHWVVERLHWRVPTTIHDLSRLYGAAEERVPAAVRLLVACLEIEIFPTARAGSSLGQEQIERLKKLQRALLYDVELDDVEPRHMLGGTHDES